jgi:hypothetical protein
MIYINISFHRKILNSIIFMGNKMKLMGINLEKYQLDFED